MLSLQHNSRAPRAGEWDRRKAMLFTVTLAATGNVTLACRSAGMSRKSAYALKRRDPLFATAWAQALLAASSKPRTAAGLRRSNGARVTAGRHATRSISSTSQRGLQERAVAELLRLRPWRAAGAASRHDPSRSDPLRP